MPSSDHEVPPRGFESGLADKVVLITGGTGGLGSATARALLSHGARVGIVGSASGHLAVNINESSTPSTRRWSRSSPTRARSS
ncbi:SDR family NAD(P)-dependent oxidoreductase [Streptomyces sp. NPDC001857]|uniref:SDR family NAD(P)-dependent oxidoreductase n=1 Tax=unclassified Streptomyces TaxID=2593676 RepID=UPI0033214A7A